jgi:hypothetical protein
MTKLRRFPLIGKCRAQATVQYVCCALRSCKARSISAKLTAYLSAFHAGAGVCIPRYIGLAFVDDEFRECQRGLPQFYRIKEEPEDGC